MVDTQIGNELGVLQLGSVDAKLAEITADGANTFTVAANDIGQFSLGQQIIFRVKATGAVFGATVRNITGITSAGVVTYDGADAALVAGTHAVYDVVPGVALAQTAKSGKVNLNGGTSENHGFSDPVFASVADMRNELKRLSAATYTDTMLNKMTYNDLVYAIRMHKYGLAGMK